MVLILSFVLLWFLILLSLCLFSRESIDVTDTVLHNGRDTLWSRFGLTGL